MISLSRTKYKQKRSSPSRESPFATISFASAFANVLLAASSGWALRKTGGLAFSNPHPSTVTFSLFLIHSMVGIVRFGNPRYGDDLRSFYESTAFLCIVVALPCFAAQFAIMYSLSDIYALSLIVLAIAMALWHFVFRIFSSVKSNGGEARWAKSKRVTFIVVLSLFFIILLSYQKLNYYGIAAALAFSHNFFLTGPTGTAFNLPAVDLFLYQLTFFNIFAVKALLD